VKGAITDDFAQSVIEIHAGRERQVHAMRAQLRGHEPSHRAREREALSRIDIELVPDAPRRRQQRKLRTEPLHPPAFLVHGDDERGRTDRMDVAHQLRQLL
jgi:hypothetical protein